MANFFIKSYPDTISYATESKRGKWTYEQGVMLEAIRRVGLATGEKKYPDYVTRNIDQFVTADGSIKTYEFDTFNLDNLKPGGQLLDLYTKTKLAKYKVAADTLRKQLMEQPRTDEGGYWHKKIYPFQMWLDGIYMAEPFLAEYASMFNEPSSFGVVANQIIFLERHTRDPATGLLYHGWDESRQQKWANATTGCSPNFWGRAIGWYLMGIVDVLDFFPRQHPRRDTLIGILRRTAEAVARYQDSETGLWYQVVDKGGREGNYLETSASCMFAYAFAKGTRLGYLSEAFHTAGQRAFKGVVEHKIKAEQDDNIELVDGVSVGGLGGNPYRDGSFEYYISEPRRTNDFKALGPFIFAALELEMR